MAENQAPVTDENTQEQGEETPEITLSDLAALRSIIDVATQRGAFRASELEAVGKTYNRLSAFLDAVTKKEQQ